MTPRPPESTRTATLFPSTTPFHSRLWNAKAPATADAERRALLSTADIIIDAWPIGSLESRGVDISALAATTVICRITPFGQTGPQRDWQAEDITLYAMSGLMQCTGDGTREPLNAGIKIAQYSGGFNAYEIGRAHV